MTRAAAERVPGGSAPRQDRACPVPPPAGRRRLGVECGPVAPPRPVWTYPVPLRVLLPPRVIVLANPIALLYYGHLPGQSNHFLPRVSSAFLPAGCPAL